MPEPFSIATGTVGLLATAVRNCIDIFEYVHVGRRFGRDYQTAQVQLAALEYRLARCSGPLLRAIEEQQDLPNVLSAGPVVDEDGAQVAMQLLGQIQVLLEDCANTTAKFAGTQAGEVDGDNVTAADSCRSGRNDAGACPAPDEETATATAGVVVQLRKMSDLAIRRRQKDARVPRLAQWAIHSRAALDRLLGQVTTLVGQLESVFPGAAFEAQRRALAREAVEDMQPPELRLLADAVAEGGVDQVLRQEAARAQAEAGAGHQYRNIDIDSGIAGTVMGGNYVAPDFRGTAVQGPSHSYDGVKIKGEKGLIVMGGDKYGGQDPFANRW